MRLQVAKPIPLRGFRTLGFDPSLDLCMRDSDYFFHRGLEPRPRFCAFHVFGLGFHGFIMPRL
jgi:hypothetical protein